MLLRLQHQVIHFRNRIESIYKEAWRDWLFEALATIPNTLGKGAKSRSQRVSSDIRENINW